MAKRRLFNVRNIQALAMLPILLPLATLLWIGSRFGLARYGLRVMAYLQQLPQIKRSAFKGYQPDARDVLVCTYSKSGTNWMLQIAYQIAQRGQGEFAHIHEVVPWPEAPTPAIVPLSDPSTYTASGMRVIKTHLESQYVPYSPDAKYLVVVRDPKEAFVSSYFFSAGLLAEGTMLPVDQWLELFLSDRFQYGSWAEHAAGYWPWRTRPNVLVLTFAEMKADLPGAVRRVAALMGVELTATELAQVVEKSTFQYMQRIDRKFQPQPPFPFNLLSRQVMIRKGERGRSGELLTAEQQARIDRHMQAELRRYGSDFPYAELFPSEPSETAQPRAETVVTSV